MNLLKQSTAITIKMGPFLDEDDGKTAETALTISQADVRLSKNGGNFAQKGDTGSATHDEIGFYDVSLNTTDTGTLGRLLIAIHESGALPVWLEYMVVPANIYDSLVSGSDNLEVDATTVSDKTGYSLATAPLTQQQARDAMKLAPSAGAPAAGSVDAHLDTIELDTNELQQDDVPGLISGLNDLSAAQVNAEVDTALADYDPPTKAELDAGLAALNDLSAAQVNAEVDTALADYDPPTKAELDAGLAGLNDPTAAAIATQVDTTLTASHGSGNWITGAGGSAPTAAEVADAVWDEARSAHTTAGSFGEGVKVESLNTQAKADVNAEADTALSDYDPPTKTEMDAGLSGLSIPTTGEIAAEVDTVLTTSHGSGNWITGAGGSAPTAAAVAAEVDTVLTASHGSGSWSSGAAGSGARTVTVTVQDSVSSAKIQSAMVRMTAAGQPDAVATTDANGQATLNVDDATYSIIVTAKSGYSSGTASQIVDENETVTINLVAISITAPSAPGLCTVAAFFRQNGVLIEGATFQAELEDENSAVADTALSLEPVSAKTDSNGRAELQLVRADNFVKGNGHYRLRIMDANGNISVDKKAAIPNADTAFLEDIL